MQDLLTTAKIHPVLVDIGASGGAPAIWKSIASLSTYVAFDPDLRDMAQSFGGEFHRRIVFNKAVTDDALSADVEFNLTAYPHCSSALTPNMEGLKDYAFQEYFATERKVRVPAITLGAVLQQTELSRIDWMKIDTQGTDLRLFTSLSDGVRSRMLALDVEPGLINAYQGEDLFVDAHRHLTQHGFWLSNLNIGSTARIRKSTLAELVPNPSMRQAFAHRAIKKSPAWAEARYMREIDLLADPNAYALLWTFAMIDRQAGFALDVALDYQRTFGADKWFEIMNRISRAHMRLPLWYSLAASMRRFIK
jgi:FkbM family methyltransferase